MAATFQFFSWQNEKCTTRRMGYRGARRPHGTGRLLLRKEAENSMRIYEARIKEMMMMM
jgi:hypothetical protein